jgi:hypothetical protein
MKFALGLFILAVSLFTISNSSPDALSPGRAVASHDTQSTASAVETADKLPDVPQSDIEPMTYPHCSVYAGNPCPTQGWTRRCQWTPFEQARCVCRSSLVWECA